MALLLRLDLTSKSLATAPNLYNIAGPNGAAKTTFARKFLPEYAHWITYAPLAGVWTFLRIA